MKKGQIHVQKSQGRWALMRGTWNLSSFIMYSTGAELPEVSLWWAVSSCKHLGRKYSSSFYTHWLCILKVLLGPKKGFVMLVLTGFASPMALRHRIFDMTLPMSTRYIRSGIQTVTQDFLSSLHTPKQNVSYFLHSLRAFCIKFRYSGKFQREFYCGFNFHPP